jgi:hypothetical protein
MNHPQNKTIDFLFSLVRNVRGAESRGIVARIYFSYFEIASSCGVDIGS